MKKIIISISIILLSLIHIGISYADYIPENWSAEIIKKYWISDKYLEKTISRREFLEILYKWYKDYEANSWIQIDYSNIWQIDNSIYFTDIDLNSEFGKKLTYFANRKIFVTVSKFNPNDRITLNQFFIIMRRLGILYGMGNCKSLKICEMEMRSDWEFTKWMYLKYISKILDKSLRTRPTTPQEYINIWYKPFLNPKYKFPMKWKSQSSSYAYTVRNILSYKYGLWVLIANTENFIWTYPIDIRDYKLMQIFDANIHVIRKHYNNIESFFYYLQQWEPLWITYMYKKYDKNWNIVENTHIVTAYSFDEIWIWITEPTENNYKRIAWDRFFYEYWFIKYNKMFQYTYVPMSKWNKYEKQKEEKYNFLDKEF